MSDPGNTPAARATERIMQTVKANVQGDLPTGQYNRIFSKVLDELQDIQGQNAAIAHTDCSPRPLTGRTFGYAIEALKNGHRVRRAGWNGKGMFLFLLPAGTVPKSAIHDPKLRAVIDEQVEGDTFEALGSIRMFTADKKILTGWLASQTDMLSKDWEIIQ